MPPRRSAPSAPSSRPTTWKSAPPISRGRWYPTAPKRRRATDGHDLHAHHPARAPPSARLARASDGTRLSTHDITGAAGAFGLIIGSEGDSWAHAAAIAAEKFGIRINVARIGAGYTDPDGVWAQVGQIGQRGAVLIRPDNHVGWRSTAAVDQPEHTLTHAIEAILGRR